MTDIIQRSMDTAANAAGNIAGPLVGGLIGTAAAVTKNAELVALALPVGAFAGAVTETGLVMTFEILQDKLGRVRRLVNAVEGETRRNFEEFMQEHGDDTNRELLGHVVDAATRARSEWKIEILAKAFVRGAQGGELVDETEMFIKVVDGMEPPHARYLAAAISAVSRSAIRATSNAMVQQADPGVGIAGILLAYRLRDMGILKEMDLTKDMRTALERDIDDSDQFFGVTELGFAVAQWLRTLARENVNEEAR